MFNSGILVQQARRLEPGKTNGHLNPHINIRHIRQTRFNRNLFPGRCEWSVASLCQASSLLI